jgi:integrase
MGRRREKRLNAIALRKLGTGMHADGNGLYLQVQESGSRSWILRTMVRGKRRDIGLGGLSTTALAEAREEAAKLRAKARKGEDVLEIRRMESRVVPTFDEAARTFHAIISKTFDSEKHAQNWFRSLDQYAIPAFGKKTVDLIDTADVLKAIAPIWTTIPDTARRTLRRISAVFEHCAVLGHRNIVVGNVTIRKPNPCDGIKAALPNTHTGEKHHKSLPYPELPQFMLDLRKTNSSLSVKLAFEFLILTTVRTSEILFARWEEFDLDAKVWAIPAERMKMEEAHKVPLSLRCLEILKLAREFNDAELVFPGRLPGEPLSNMSMLMVLRRMGREGLTAHGFRATFKTWAEEKTNYDSLVIEAALAHKVKGIERHYLRTTFFEKRKRLMDTWAAFATAAPPVKVVKMRAQKGGEA